MNDERKRREAEKERAWIEGGMEKAIREDGYDPKDLTEEELSCWKAGYNHKELQRYSRDSWVADRWHQFPVPLLEALIEHYDRLTADRILEAIAGILSDPLSEADACHWYEVRHAARRERLIAELSAAFGVNPNAGRRPN